MNPNPVSIEIGTTFKRLKVLMKEYEISSFLVVEKELVQKEAPKSPRRIASKMEKIAGILTQRDINRLEFDDQKIEDFMTPLDKLIYYEVSPGFSDEKYNLDSLLE